MSDIGPAVEVVYGASLSALRYAHQHGIHIILEDPLPLPPYTNPTDQKEWANLTVDLMLRGKAIGGDGVTGAHLHDDYVSVVSRGNVVNKIPYRTIYFFSDKKVIGLPVPTQLATRFQVVDHLQQVSLSVPHLYHIHTGDELARDIYLVKDGQRNKTQLYVISSIATKNLHNFDFSDTMVRFKCEEVLRQHGFAGSSNGKHKRLLKLETIARTVSEPMHSYDSTERLKFCYGD
jgi:hypothetical protein